MAKPCTSQPGVSSSPADLVEKRWAAYGMEKKNPDFRYFQILKKIAYFFKWTSCQMFYLSITLKYGLKNSLSGPLLDNWIHINFQI